MANAKIDDNYKKTLTAVEDDLGAAIARLKVDAATGRLKVSATALSGVLSSLNGLTTGTQFFAIGASGNQFNISSSGSTHTFNLPTASASGTGQLTATDWTTFNNKLSSFTANLPLSYSGGSISISKSSASGSGYLSGNDFATFNGKQDKLSFSSPILTSGTGTTVYLSATGSGSAVLQTSPTLITPSLGASTGSTISLDGTTSQIYLKNGTETCPFSLSSVTGDLVITPSGGDVSLSNTNLGLTAGKFVGVYGGASARAVFNSTKVNILSADLEVDGSGSVKSISINDSALEVSGGSINATGSAIFLAGVQFGALAYYDAEYNNGNYSGTGTVNWLNGNVQSGTITAATTLVFIAPPGPGHFTLKLSQDDHSGGTITWPAVKWSGGSILSTGSLKSDIATFYFDGVRYYGMLSTNFI